MRTGSLIVLLVIGGVYALAAPAASPAKPSFEHINALVARLGSGKFKDRQAATRELDALGPAALNALRAAASDPDAEVRRRATALAERIEKRIETAQVLTPTRLRFVCKDKPVADAVAEFSRKTGFAVQIDPAARTKLGNRRVTLDTGETTFWDAFERLCDKAGLVEAAPKTAPQPAASPYEVNVRVVSLDYSPYGRTVSGPVMLEAGKPERVATFHAGAVRIKALSSRIPLLGHSRDEGETLFGLEVDHEPQMQWQGVVGMRILRAIDGRGLRLTQPNVYVGESVSSPYDGMNFVVFSGDVKNVPAAKDARQVPVHLRLQNDRVRKLRELSGMLSAQVQTPPMPLITVPDLLKSAGRTFKGPDGHAVKVIDAKRQANGRVRLQVRVDARTQNFGGMPGGFVVMGGGGMMVDSAVAGPGNLALQDARGRALRLVKVEGQNWLPNPGGTSVEWTLVYQLPRSQAEPVKLIYTGTRTLVIDVPFTLKDVVLP
ncbi:MAG TPA: hypothetical protein VG013_42500 [Gemmataceae bacterium]|nr:hypothetical protein [Gemmataceae bacterium]